MSRDPCRRRDGLHRPRFFSFVLFHTPLWFQNSPILPCFSFKRVACLPASLSALNPCERHHLPLRGLLAPPGAARPSRDSLTRPSLRSLRSPLPGAFSSLCLPFSVFLPLTFSQRPWPVDGGEANPPAAVPSSLILTGPFRLQEELTNDASCHITH